MADQQRHDRLGGHDVVTMDSESIETIVNSLVQNPTFQETISAILSRRVEFTTPPSMLQNSNRGIPPVPSPTTYSPVPSPTASSTVSRQRPNIYQTAQQEFSALFNRSSARRLGGGSATLARPTRSRSGSTRATCATNRSRYGKKPPYIFKEVVLLDKADITQIVRGPPKAVLMEKGFIYNDVQVSRKLSQQELVNLLEQLFAKQLSLQSWNVGEKKFKLMIGMGHTLVEPRLTREQELNAEVVHRTFGTKIVWLLPSKDLLLDDDPKEDIMRNYEICENCGMVIASREDHMELCHGGPSSMTATQTDSLSNNDDQQVAILAEIFPNAPLASITATLLTTSAMDDAIDILSTSGEDESKIMTCQGIVNVYRENLLFNDGSYHTLVIKRQSIWRDALCFYKMTLGNKQLLSKKLSIEFAGEEGVDGGALSIEFFVKVFEAAKSELFEETPKGHLIPKRSGGNLQLFKIFGIVIGHSLLQGGPPFSCLSSWCFSSLAGKSDDEIAGIISRESYEDAIPLNAASSTLLSFLNALADIKCDNDVEKLFDDTAEGPAYEQVVNSSQWPIETKITVANLEALRSILIWEELVLKRERQLRAIREGLAFVGFLSYIEKFPQQLSDLFVVSNVEITSQAISSIIAWEEQDCLDENEQHVLVWFKEFLEKSSRETLIKLLRFATSFDAINAVNKPHISLSFTNVTKTLPESVACASTLLLPLGNKSQEEFARNMTTALDLASEGYGNL